ncbi:HNH endonuclease [Kitasatospora sp. NPDC085930]
MAVWDERGWYGCFYCDGPLTDMQLDHVVPLSRGGLDGPSNLVPACAACNGAKGDEPADTFTTGTRGSGAVATRTGCLTQRQ